MITFSREYDEESILGSELEFEAETMDIFLNCYHLFKIKKSGTFQSFYTIQKMKKSGILQGYDRIQKIV